MTVELSTTCVEFAALARRRSTWVIMLLGLVLVSVSVLGFSSQDAAVLASQGGSTPQLALQLAVSQSFAMGLFASVLGVIGLTRPLGDGSARLVFHARPSWRAILGAKALATSLVGIVYGVVTAVVSVSLATRTLGDIAPPSTFTDDTLWLLAGIVFLCAVSGAFGTFVGALGRRQTPTVIGLIVWTIGIEGGLIALLPNVGKWLPGGAIASLVGDLSLPERLPPAQGVALDLAWVAALGVAATFSLRRWAP